MLFMEEAVKAWKINEINLCRCIFKNFRYISVKKVTWRILHKLAPIGVNTNWRVFVCLFMYAYHWMDTEGTFLMWFLFIYLCMVDCIFQQLPEERSVGQKCLEFLCQSLLSIAMLNENLVKITLEEWQQCLQWRILRQAPPLPKWPQFLFPVMMVTKRVCLSIRYTEY